jgi:hypothetical protein
MSVYTIGEESVELCFSQNKSEADKKKIKNHFRVKLCDVVMCNQVIH